MMQPKRKKRGKQPKLRQPAALERQYKRYLRGVVAEYAKLVRSQIIPILPQLISERDSQVRSDGWVDTIERAVSVISLSSERTNANAKREAIKVGEGIADFNSAEWKATVRGAVGVDIFRSEPWIADELASFASENVKLITSLPAQSLDKIEGIVQRGVRSGTSASTLSKQITNELGIARRRADLVARDQVATLNGQITKVRQEAIGIKTYYWDTAGDERVRKSHAKLDGKLCRWDNDKVYSDDDGKTWKQRSSIGAEVASPGQPINCRCGARANTDELLASLGV